MVVGVVVSYKH